MPSILFFTRRFFYEFQGLQCVTGYPDANVPRTLLFERLHRCVGRNGPSVGPALSHGLDRNLMQSGTRGRLLLQLFMTRQTSTRAETMTALIILLI